MSDFFRLRRWVAPYRGRLFSAILCSIVSVVCLTAGVVLIKPIIQQMAPARPGAVEIETFETAGMNEETPGAATSGGEASGDLVERIRDGVARARKSLEAALGVPAIRAWLAESPYTRLPLLI